MQKLKLDEVKKNTPKSSYTVSYPSSSIKKCTDDTYPSSIQLENTEERGFVMFIVMLIVFLGISSIIAISSLIMMIMT